MYMYIYIYIDTQIRYLYITTKKRFLVKLEIVRKKERKKETSVKYICESTHSVYPYLFTTMYTVYAILARDTQVI